MVGRSGRRRSHAILGFDHQAFPIRTFFILLQTAWVTHFHAIHQSATAALAFTIYACHAQPLIVSYQTTQAITIDGDSLWQQVCLSPSDFTKRSGESPETWDGLDIVISLPARWAWEDLKMRNLT